MMDLHPSHWEHFEACSVQIEFPKQYMRSSMNMGVEKTHSLATKKSMDLTLKGQCKPHGLGIIREGLVQNFYSTAPDGVFKMPNRAS